MHFSARGYSSATELWNAAQRFHDDAHDGVTSVLLYCGDHDASGVDMDRYIRERLELFGCRVIFKRVALTFDQVQQYNLAPNPAKQTDSRFEGYVAQYGNEAWELDALDPPVIDALLRQATQEYINNEKWEQAEEEEADGRWRFEELIEHWPAVVSYLGLDKHNKRRPENTPPIIELGPAGSTSRNE